MHSSAPVHSDPKTETADELSYDEFTQVLKFREMSFPGTNPTQFKVIKYLYDADTKGNAGVSTKALVTAVGLHSNSLRNLFQRKGKPLKQALIDYDQHSKLWRFKIPHNKPRPN